MNSELKKKREDSLIHLLASLDEFGEAWEDCFNDEQFETLKKLIEMFTPIMEIANYAGPVQATFTVAAILHRQIEHGIVAIADMHIKD